MPPACETSGWATAMPTWKRGRKSCRLKSLSPVAIGIDVDCASLASRCEFSGTTGSSMKNGWSGSSKGASRRDSLEDGVDLANRTERSHRSGRIHLHGGQSDVELRLDRLGNPAWIIAADPSVHPDPVSDRTSEQLMDRDAQRLALDVPQRLVYAGHGAAQDRTTAVETALGEHLPVILNARGIAADEVLRELVDHCTHGVRMPFEARFAPADDTCLGLDPDEQPPGRHQKGLDTANRHGQLPFGG